MVAHPVVERPPPVPGPERQVHAVAEADHPAHVGHAPLVDRRDAGHEVGEQPAAAAFAAGEAGIGKAPEGLEDRQPVVLELVGARCCISM